VLIIALLYFSGVPSYEERQWAKHQIIINSKQIKGAVQHDD